MMFIHREGQVMVTAVTKENIHHHILLTESDLCITEEVEEEAHHIPQGRRLLILIAHHLLMSIEEKAEAISNIISQGMTQDRILQEHLHYPLRMLEDTHENILIPMDLEVNADIQVFLRNLILISLVVRMQEIPETMDMVMSIIGMSVNMSQFLLHSLLLFTMISNLENIRNIMMSIIDATTNSNIEELLLMIIQVWICIMFDQEALMDSIGRLHSLARMILIILKVNRKSLNKTIWLRLLLNPKLKRNRRNQLRLLLRWCIKRQWSMKVTILN
jgi:hypothetical protein